MKKIIIALDGYAATGKSSTAKQVASKLGFIYIDSGAMYRAVTFHFLKNNVDPTNAEEVTAALKNCEITFYNGATHLNGKNVETKIRTMEVSKNVSTVSTISSVRTKLVQQQRKMGASGGVVMDGRDIGTVVFPQAELKIFMTANVDERTERRKIQLEQKGTPESEEDIREDIIRRDNIDSTREDSPLKRVDDAIEIDTSHLTLDQQINKIVALAKEIIIHES